MIESEKDQALHEAKHVIQAYEACIRMLKRIDLISHIDGLSALTSDTNSAIEWLKQYGDSIK